MNSDQKKPLQAIQHPNCEAQKVPEERKGDCLDEKKKLLVQNFKLKRRLELWTKVFDFPSVLWQNLQAKVDLKEVSSFVMPKVEQSVYVPVLTALSGKFDCKRVPFMALEVVSVRQVAQSFEMELKDFARTSVGATFHESCRDQVLREVRIGRVLLLQEVGLFRRGGP